MRKLRNSYGVHPMERSLGQHRQGNLALAPLARQAVRGIRALRIRRTHESARIAHPRGVARGRVPARQAEGGLETAAHNLAVRVAKRRCDAASRAHLYNLLPLSRTAFPPRRATSTAALAALKHGS